MMNRSYRRPIFRGAAATVASLTLIALAAPAAHAAATTPPLGTAANFAAVAATTITNTGPTQVTGNLGVFPGTAIVGFPPGIVTGAIHAGDAVADTAAADAETAYNMAAGQPCDRTLAANLGGVTLAPGVTCFSSPTVGLTGTLTLDAQGNPNAAWIIKTASTLITASNSAVVLINGATPCNNNNITWQIGSSATLGSATSFIGNILASASVTLNTGATSTGSLYGNTGAVTMDTNNVRTCASAAVGQPGGGLAGPAITTTPSGSVPVGGSISDSARVIGGASPTGSVVFQLFGPGDTTCTTPIATRTGVLSGPTATSGNVTATAAGTYNWVARYGGDAANAPAISPCGSETVLVTSQILTGRAYGLGAHVTAIGLPIVNILPIPDTGHVATTSSSSTTTPCVATLSGAIGAHALCANVTTTPSPSRSRASASVADASVAITLIPTVKTGAVQSTSTTTCAGSSGTTTIAYLKVGTTVVIAQPTNVAPNTNVTVGAVKLVLNEQIPFTMPDAGLTVNAVHQTVSALGVAANVIIASSESDIGNCP
ncbi:MAG TPA: ice-binding family protein [Solirubrobacteraceae bacterium]|nr:ice-binding family protein [Solirubrobacteraceae bacterium]